MTMTGQPEGTEQQLARRATAGLRSLGHPNSIARATDFWDDSYEWRHLFAEVLGTFFLVLVAVGGGMVNARFGGQAVPYSARVVAPALMVVAVILFMGAVSGAHLNPAVSIAFACAATSRGSGSPCTSSPSSRGPSWPPWAACTYVTRWPGGTAAPVAANPAGPLHSAQDGL
jgi:hypothetical protein